MTGSSTTGWLMLFLGSPVVWKSKRQYMVATSSFFAEVVAMCRTIDS